MSDNIAVDIQVEIMKRLPVKLLIQLRSLSKSWKSMMDRSDFIAGYSLHHSQPQRLLVKSLIDCSDSSITSPISHTIYNYLIKTNYVSIVDDNTFPQQNVYLPKPPLLKKLELSRIIGSSHGLMCLSGYISSKSMAVLWNPTIRKAVAVVVPNVEDAYGIYETVLGFGVCRETNDPKIVKITQIRWRNDIETMPHSTPRQVEVFTLSTGSWRRRYSNNLPRKSIYLYYNQVVVDGCLYWLAADRTTDDGSSYCILIILFDMTSEEFTEVNLPESLAQHNLSIFKRRESLVVLQSGVEADNEVFTLWMMEDGVTKLFTKLFTFKINKPDALSLIRIHGFRKNGEPIIEITKNNRQQLGVYEPDTEHIAILAGMNGKEGLFSVYPYMETLLLLDKLDHTVYNERGTP